MVKQVQSRDHVLPRKSSEMPENKEQLTNQASIDSRRDIREAEPGEKPMITDYRLDFENLSD